jgi:hypothetical protein
MILETHFVELIAHTILGSNSKFKMAIPCPIAAVAIFSHISRYNAGMHTEIPPKNTLIYSSLTQRELFFSDLPCFSPYGILQKNGKTLNLPSLQQKNCKNELVWFNH